MFGRTYPSWQPGTAPQPPPVHSRPANFVSSNVHDAYPHNEHAGYDEDYDDDEWDDDSDDEIYENEHQNSSHPTRDAPNRPPARPPFNPPRDMGPPHSFNHMMPRHQPPPLQPHHDHTSSGDADDGDSLYLPIDNDSAPTNHGRVSMPSHSVHNSNAISPGRPSFPPPSPSRPQMPIPSSHNDKPNRTVGTPISPHSSRSSKGSPSSPGPPSRGSSERSSGSRTPHRGGSGRSIDSSCSGSSDHGAPIPLPPKPDHSSRKFQNFKDQPGFNTKTPLPQPGGLTTMPPTSFHNKPTFADKQSKKPALPSSRKPATMPKPTKHPQPSTTNSSELANVLSNRFKKLESGASQTGLSIPSVPHKSGRSSATDPPHFGRPPTSEAPRPGRTSATEPAHLMRSPVPYLPVAERKPDPRPSNYLSHALPTTSNQPTFEYPRSGRTASTTEPPQFGSPPFKLPNPRRPAVVEPPQFDRSPTLEPPQSGRFSQTDPPHLARSPPASSPYAGRPPPPTPSSTGRISVTEPPPIERPPPSGASQFGRPPISQSEPSQVGRFSSSGSPHLLATPGSGHVGHFPPSQSRLISQPEAVEMTSSDHHQQPLTTRVEQQSWFKNVARAEAAKMIERNCQVGRFIVRPGKDEDRPYSMTVYAGKIFNLMIRLRSDRRYALGKYKDNEDNFSSVLELVQYHMEKPLVLANGLGSVKLIGPP